MARSAGPRTPAPTLRERLVLGARVAVASVVLTVTALMAWTLLPLLLGWSSHVVVSGSMEPRLRVGDVVVSQPVAAGEITSGQVVLARPTWAGGATVAHRAVERTADGSVVTRGDANQSADPEPVAATTEVGLARLRVPFVGLPFVWLSAGDAHLAVLALAVLLASSLVVAHEPRTGVLPRAVPAGPRHRGA